MNLSYWAYLPSLAANGIFTALFSLSLALYVVQAVYSRRFLAFSIAMLCGSVLEVIGYVGRLMSYHNPFSQVSPPIQVHACLNLPDYFNINIIFVASVKRLTYNRTGFSLRLFA
jgi:hypothetical protein